MAVFLDTVFDGTVFDAGPLPAWTPANIFSASEVGFWGDVTPARLWQDIARTIPVTAPFQAVASYEVNTASGVIYFEQPDPAKRPIYRTDNGVGYLLFDGIDDFLKTAGSISSADRNYQAFASIRPTSLSGIRNIIDADVGTVRQAQYIRINTGNAEAIVFNGPNPNFDTGPAVTNNADTVLTAIAITGTSLDIRVDGVSNGATATGNTFNNETHFVEIGRSGFENNYFEGRFYGVILRLAPNLTAPQIADANTWMAGLYAAGTGVTETAVTGHAQTASIVGAAAITETAVTGHAQTASIVGAAAITETAATGDAQAAALVRVGAITETAATGDVPDAAVPSGVVVTETTTTGDAQTSILTAVAVVAESAATGHTQAAARIGSGAITETAATGHAQTASIVGAAAITETAATGHAQTAALVRVGAITETAATGHAQDAAPAVSDARTETAATGHAQTAALVRVGAITETAATGHAQITTQIARAGLTESAAAGDTCAAVVIRSASVIEVVTATDQIAAGLSIAVGLTEVVAANDAYLFDFEPPSVFLRRGKATKTIYAAQASTRTKTLLKGTTTETALTTPTRGRYGATETSTVMQ